MQPEVWTPPESAVADISLEGDHDPTYVCWSCVHAALIHLTRMVCLLGKHVRSPTMVCSIYVIVVSAVYVGAACHP